MTSGGPQIFDVGNLLLKIYINDLDGKIKCNIPEFVNYSVDYEKDQRRRCRWSNKIGEDRVGGIQFWQI